MCANVTMPADPSWLEKGCASPAQCNSLVNIGNSTYNVTCPIKPKPLSAFIINSYIGIAITAISLWISI